MLWGVGRCKELFTKTWLINRKKKNARELRYRLLLHTKKARTSNELRNLTISLKKTREDSLLGRLCFRPFPAFDLDPPLPPESFEETRQINTDRLFKTRLTSICFVKVRIYERYGIRDRSSNTARGSYYRSRRTNTTSFATFACMKHNYTQIHFHKFDSMFPISVRPLRLSKKARTSNKLRHLRNSQNKCEETHF